MRRLGVAPKVTDFTKEVHSVNDWLLTINERMRLYSGANDPVVSEVPNNQWVLYYNTTLSELRLWANLNGTLLRSSNFIDNNADALLTEY